MNKYENPIDTIGIEPSGTEVNIPHLYDNATFTAVLNKASSERKSAKEKILSGETPMPDFDSIQRKQAQMQEANSLPFQSANTETIRFTSDPSVTSIEIFHHRKHDFYEDETIEGCAIYIEDDRENLKDFRGLYLMKGPTTHDRLRSAIRLDGGISLPLANDNFSDRGYIHGYYTNKGRFINRRQAVHLIEENDIPTAVPRADINSYYGAMSTDIWNESGRPSTYRNNGLGSDEPFDLKKSITGILRKPDEVVVRPKDSKGKTIPKTASEMMAEKRLKKMMKRYGQN